MASFPPLLSSLVLPVVGGFATVVLSVLLNLGPLRKIYAALSAPLVIRYPDRAPHQLLIHQQAFRLWCAYVATGFLFAIGGGGLLPSPSPDIYRVHLFILTGLLVCALARMLAVFSTAELARTLMFMEAAMLGSYAAFAIYDRDLLWRWADMFDVLSVPADGIPPLVVTLLVGATTLGLATEIAICWVFLRPASQLHEVPYGLVRERAEADEMSRQVMLACRGGSVIQETNRVILGEARTCVLPRFLWVTHTSPYIHLGVFREAMRARYIRLGLLATENGRTDDRQLDLLLAHREHGPDIRIIVDNQKGIDDLLDHFGAEDGILGQVLSASHIRTLEADVHLRSRKLVLSDTTALLHLPIPFQQRSPTRNEANFMTRITQPERVCSLEEEFETLWRRCETTGEGEG